MIQEIPKDLARAIRSQQYVHSSYIIVKELIENALDAHSSRIKIQLNDRIIVEDDGDGIEDLVAVCRCGYTSKEDASYNVLQIENKATHFSHGFRGQALASIKELCDVEISTRVRVCGEKGDVDGGLGFYRDFQAGTIQRYPRGYGTTVKVGNLFKNCAVRRQLNEKSRRKNCAQILTLVRAFCYVYNVTFTVVERDKLLYSAQGSEDTRGYAIKRHGDVYLEAEDEYFSLLLFPLCKDKIQTIILGKRIVSCSRLTGTINSLFKRYFDYTPTFVLLLKDAADVNVSVDKAEVVLRNMKLIESRVRSEMDLYFSQRLFIHKTPRQLEDPSADITQGIPFNESHSAKDTCSQASLSEISNPGRIATGEYAHPGTASSAPAVDFEGTVPLLSIGAPKTVISNVEAALHSSIVSSTGLAVDGVAVEVSPPRAHSATSHPEGPVHASQSYMPAAPKAISESFGQGLAEPVSAYSLMREEVLEHPDVQINKADFKNMRILGQFNQGFILCTLDKENESFLLTVDQHAADEIYNFERLQQTFCLKKQRLVAPILLDLPPIQMLTVEDNLETFANNGFTVEGNKLLTIPVYKDYFFTLKDFHSLLENIPSEIYESDKFREIMASKACRSSVMIGTALNLRDMRKIVDNLSMLKHPWNCPHGRPTFKILTKL